jgi:hypothetical protein
MQRIFATILVAINSLACNQGTSNREVPGRIQGIPDSAFWVGGSDGGNWYLVKNIDANKNSAYISIYHDFTGDLLLSKKFTLNCPVDIQVSIDDLKTQIIAFDGEKIIISAGNGKRNCLLQ